MLECIERLLQSPLILEHIGAVGMSVHILLVKRQCSIQTLQGLAPPSEFMEQDSQIVECFDTARIQGQGTAIADLSGLRHPQRMQDQPSIAVCLDLPRHPFQCPIEAT
ncbi:hypothetical protein AY586_16650 [Marichromatium gracile]|uniref:Uncharacterized protein n=1 Tax=Marichromatium gracile TaxID=1048 RepID=A0ABR5VGT1_MARGR|nr:hypothetical protein AY586_16650 [Marichromatium gracile]